MKVMPSSFREHIKHSSKFARERRTSSLEEEGKLLSEDILPLGFFLSYVFSGYLCERALALHCTGLTLYLLTESIPNMWWVFFSLRVSRGEIFVSLVYVVLVYLSVILLLIIGI